ncbi:MAG TPA: hypothetical protein VFQ56_08135, partial [Flavobacterium sp.]|nr:hypothetical protein [Flavobacterium sp.]
MLNDSFYNFLATLSFTETDLAVGMVDENTFNYQVDEATGISVKYILTPEKEDIFFAHRLLWNRNQDNVFVAVSKSQSYIINAKEKPNSINPLKGSICLKTFEYGTNSKGFENIKPTEISKQYIDSAFFFDFVSKYQKKRQEVDKDL